MQISTDSLPERGAKLEVILKAKRTKFLSGYFIFSVLLFAGGGQAYCSSGSGFSGQVEADWQLQERVRGVGAVSGKKVKAEADSAGGVDGIIKGTWGFHTENEANPWWQVDLGKSYLLDRMRVFNRTELAGRAARMIVKISLDGKSFEQIYQHDGATFLGHADKKPLVVKLKGVEARFVRLQLPAKSYFHLDEVEIFAVGFKANVALHKPATQSSTSQWSVNHNRQSGMDIDKVLERGFALAKDLQELEVEVSKEKRTLQEIKQHLKQQSLPEASIKELYLRARWAVRRMALANPLLQDFDRLLFVKRKPGSFPHVSDQYYGWWAQGGGGIYLLEGFRGDKPRERCLTADWEEGSFLRPDLSYDGKKVLFSYCKYYPHVAGMDKVNKEKLPEEAFYHLYEMNLDGRGVRPLTNGRYDDFDGRYLPDGDIVFLSTRKGTFVQTLMENTKTTCQATQADSYVRCGGGDHRPVSVYTLHRMNGQGKELRPISAFENFEWTPSVADDGRILYARWDYIDRHNGNYMSLWSANQDGTNPQLVYGNFTAKPQCIFEARSIPNSRKLIFTATAHHSITGGSLVLLDRKYGTEYERPLTRLTPEVCFPETEGWPNSYYANPWPLSENYYLTAWSAKKLPPHAEIRDQRNPVNALGIYLCDRWGNLELLYRDPEISSMYPIPVRSRRMPPVQPNTVDWAGKSEGSFLVQDVYQGLDGIARGSIKRIRIVGVPPKVQPHMHNPSIGITREDPGKYVLGTTPVEADGSAYFRVPAGVSYFFQALDEQGRAVQTMRSLTYVQPGQNLSCIGCHEHRDQAPAQPIRKKLQQSMTAARKPPAPITLGPEGSWPLRYDKLVQPVLDQHCVECHRPGGDDSGAAKFNLTASKSYETLLQYGKPTLAERITTEYQRGYSAIGVYAAQTSLLLGKIDGAEDHYGVELNPEARERLVIWLDTYAQRAGSFSARQERELLALRKEHAEMFRKYRVFGTHAKEEEPQITGLTRTNR